jgi:hypothetical protein
LSGVDCVVSRATRGLLQGVCFHRIEDHGVTLLILTLKGFGINQIYFLFSMNLKKLHNTEEAEKWLTFWYEILIMFFLP